MFRHKDSILLSLFSPLPDWQLSIKTDEDDIYADFIETFDPCRRYAMWHHVPQSYSFVNIEFPPKNVYLYPQPPLKEHYMEMKGCKYIFWNTSYKFRGQVAHRTRYSWDFFSLYGHSDWYYVPFEKIKLLFEHEVPLSFFVVT